LFNYTVVYKSEESVYDYNFVAVIPCIQEEKTIGMVIKNLKKVFNQNIFTTVIVNSYTDPTIEEAIKNGVDAVILAKEKGYGYAINTGLHFLSTLFKDDVYVVMIDGDNTYDISSIDVSSLQLDKNTLVIGVRKLKKNNMKLLNRVGNSFLNFIFRLFFYKKVSDSQS